MKPTEEQIQAGIDAFYGSNKTGPLFAVRGLVEVILEAALSAPIMSAIEPAGVGVETPPPSSHVAVTDAMVSAARAAFATATGVDEDHQFTLDGWIEEALRSAIEAALATTEGSAP